MSTDAGTDAGRDADDAAERARAHALIDGMDAGPWRMDRGPVVDRLHELVANPALIRQGKRNLCGPAALMQVWLRRDPVAAVTYATQLYGQGQAHIGSLPVSPSGALLRTPYGRTERELTCPGADWMLMAALRDSTNRVLPYTSGAGPAEAAAAITTPRVLRRWLLATGLYGGLSDETNLVLRRPMVHAGALDPAPERDVFLLVASEMFRTPAARWRRARDRIVSLLPNHWVILRAPLAQAGDGGLDLRFWSWGADYRATMAQQRFARCYYGALVADVSHESK